MAGLLELETEAEREARRRAALASAPGVAGFLGRAGQAVGDAYRYVMDAPERIRQQTYDYAVSRGMSPEMAAASADRVAGRAGRMTGAIDLLVPQTAADVALTAAGPLGRIAPAAGRAALMAGGGLLAMEPGEAEAGRGDAVARGARNILERITGAPMVALHNTRGDRLERIGRSGGDVVAPSIAISRADNPIESFGDISLLAGPQTVNPSRTPVYGRDAYTPRYPDVETRNVRGEDREVIRVMNENTGEWRSLPHTPENALRVMRREPWRGGEDFITDNWLLGQLTPQFRNMSELRNARDRLVPATDTAVADWTKGLDSLRSEWTRVLSEAGYPTDWRFADSLQRNLAEAANRRDGMAYINRTYYNNAIPEDLLSRTQAHLAAGRELPATYFEAKPRRLVPLNEFQGAVVPEGAPQDVTDLLRRYGVEDIRYYANPEARREQIRNYERLFFSGAPLAAGLLGGADGSSEQ